MPPVIYGFRGIHTHTYLHESDFKKPEACWQLHTSGLKIDFIINFVMHLSRLTTVSSVAKESRTCDTTVCYMHEQSILIECSPKAYSKKLPNEKTRITKTTHNH